MRSSLPHLAGERERDPWAHLETSAPPEPMFRWNWEECRFELLVIAGIILVFLSMVGRYNALHGR